MSEQVYLPEYRPGGRKHCDWVDELVKESGENSILFFSENFQDTFYLELNREQSERIGPQALVFTTNKAPVLHVKVTNTVTEVSTEIPQLQERGQDVRAGFPKNDDVELECYVCELQAELAGVIQTFMKESISIAYVLHKENVAVREEIAKALKELPASRRFMTEHKCQALINAFLASFAFARDLAELKDDSNKQILLQRLKWNRDEMRRKYILQGQKAWGMTGTSDVCTTPTDSDDRRSTKIKDPGQEKIKSKSAQSTNSVRTQTSSAPPSDEKPRDIPAEKSWPTRKRRAASPAFKMASAVLVSLTLALVEGASTTPKLLGKFSVQNAAFVSVLENHAATNKLDRYNLFVATFNGFPLSSDYVYEVPAIGRHLSDVTHIHSLALTHSVTWPNEVNSVPTSVFYKDMVAVAGGFLVPTKDRGSVTLFDVSKTPHGGPYSLTDHAQDDDWFYHRVAWKDMNNDGRVDAVTCRAKKPLIGSGHGELVWLEHPASGELTHPWTTHVITEGPDVFFALARLPTAQGLQDCIVTAGFFSQQLSVHWTTDPKGSWADPSKVKHRVIESGIGQVFDVSVDDLNNDGQPDLLVTNNNNHGANLYAFQVPSDFRTGSFARHTLASGFRPRGAGLGKGAPGSAQTFSPGHTSGGKPLILLSGDDDGRAYVISPGSEDKSDWSYKTTAFLDVGSSTVGGIAAVDADGDGWLEVFVPSYNTGEVYVYTFTP